MIYDTYEELEAHRKADKMTNGQLLEEFHKSFGAKRKQEYANSDNSDLEQLAFDLIKEEFEEFQESYISDQTAADALGELADLVYVAYGYADRFGWDLDKAVRRKHVANMSKLDPVTGKPILREDGKILKGPNFKPAYLGDLV